MLRSTVINRRQHFGLQKLAALAGIAQSCLGPSKTYKFIHDDTSGESALVCSCFHICENLELTCTVGQLLYETLKAHQKVYNTGSGCLLFLAGAWSRAALECLHRGMSMPHIISAMAEGIETCIDVCRKYTVSIEGLGLKTCHLQGTTSGCQKTLNTSAQRKIRLSRHFCEDKSQSVSPRPHQPELLNIAHIAEGLSHGCINAMNLVVEVYRLQSKANQDMSHYPFDITQVVSCVLPGVPEEHACVLPGYAVMLSDEQASVASRLQEHLLKVALIHGDLSHTFRHLGFSQPVGVQHVRDQSALLNSDKEEEWMAQVVTLLLNLEVNLILLSGLASEKVIQHCCRHHVLVVEKVKASVLRALAYATGGVPVTYATQLTKHCVGTGVKVATWRDLDCGERKHSSAVNISTDGSSGLVTVILASCIHGKLQSLEDQFWACAYRLHHALKDKALLPGAGVTEVLCVHHLHKQARQHAMQQSKAGQTANPHRGVVLHLMADGLNDYVSTVMVNTGKFSKVKARTLVSQQLQDCNGDPGVAAKFSQLFLDSEKEDGTFFTCMEPEGSPAMKVYDNLSVKQEAWRKALDLVFLVLQTDAEVITGVNQNTAAQENLMML